MRLNRLVPEFILQKQQNNIVEGALNNRFSFFADISGFTNLTNNLMAYDKAGLEILTLIMNEAFSTVIDHIYKKGGFISNFEGDSFIAVFPESTLTFEDLNKICNYILNYWSSLSVKQIIKKHPVYQNTELVNVENCFSGKIGIGFGNISWEIFQNQKKSLFIFGGSAVKEALLNEGKANKNEIVFNNYEKLKHKNSSKSLPAKEKTSSHSLSESKFILEEILQLPDNYQGEFRRMITCFIRLGEYEKGNKKQVQNYLLETAELCQKYKGYFNRVINGSKGLFCLVIFGVPRSLEKIQLAAASFSQEIIALAKADYKKLSVNIGLSLGINYSGFIGNMKRAEYTAFGEQINLAARISGIKTGRRHNIFIEENIFETLHKSYKTVKLESKNLKGFREKQKVYKLKNKRELEKNNNQLIYREKQHKELSKFYNIFEKNIQIPNTTNRFFCFIKGKAGIGKTCFVDDFYNDIKDSMLTIEINFSEYEINDQEMIWDGIISSLDKKEINSSIRRLVHRYNQKDFYNAIIIIEFLSDLTKIVPVQIFIEDLHWSSRETTDFLLNLVSSDNINNLLLIATSRENLQKQDLFEILTEKKLVSHKRINLKELKNKEIKQFLKFQIGKDYSKILEYKELFPEILKFIAGNPLLMNNFAEFLKNTPREKLLKIETFQNIFETSTIKSKFKTNDNHKLLYLNRYDRLSFFQKNILKQLSVLDDGCKFSFLQKLLKSSRNSVIFAIEELEHKQFIKTDKKRIKFSHVLIRNTIYEVQLKSEQIQFHKSVAMSYCSKLPLKTAEEYELMGYHFEKAGNIKEAIKSYWGAYKKNEIWKQLKKGYYILKKLQHLYNQLKLTNLNLKYRKYTLEYQILDNKINRSTTVNDPKLIKSAQNLMIEMQKNKHQVKSEKFIKKQQYMILNLHLLIIPFTEFNNKYLNYLKRQINILKPNSYAFLQIFNQYQMLNYYYNHDYNKVIKLASSIINSEEIKSTKFQIIWERAFFIAYKSYGHLNIYDKEKDLYNKFCSLNMDKKFSEKNLYRLLDLFVNSGIIGKKQKIIYHQKIINLSQNINFQDSLTTINHYVKYLRFLLKSNIRKFEDLLSIFNQFVEKSFFLKQISVSDFLTQKNNILFIKLKKKIKIKNKDIEQISKYKKVYPDFFMNAKFFYLLGSKNFNEIKRTANTYFKNLKLETIFNSNEGFTNFLNLLKFLSGKQQKKILTSSFIFNLRFNPLKLIYLDTIIPYLSTLESFELLQKYLTSVKNFNLEYMNQDTINFLDCQFSKVKLQRDFDLNIQDLKKLNLFEAKLPIIKVEIMVFKSLLLPDYSYSVNDIINLDKQLVKNFYRGKAFFNYSVINILKKKYSTAQKFLKKAILTKENIYPYSPILTKWKVMNQFLDFQLQKSVDLSKIEELVISNFTKKNIYHLLYLLLQALVQKNIKQKKIISLTIKKSE